MKLTTAFLKKTAYMLCASFAALCCFASCNSVIYDDEGDCVATYLVKFRYDRNMKWADAFQNEVTSVHLYAFDPDGVLVWHDEEKGAALAADNYRMRVDLPAGTYTFLAWCGMDNDAQNGESFSVPDVKTGRTRLADMRNRMQREYENGAAVSRKRLYDLYHGLETVTLPDLSTEGGEYTVAMPLTKDTNHVRVILQHLSGETVNPDDFTFRIEEANGLMAHDNSLMDDEMITYFAHDKKSGVAGLGIDDYPEVNGKKGAPAAGTRAATSVSVAVADLTVPRLVKDRKTYLTITTKDGETAARVPLTDYALLLKDNYRHEMSDQEYLDRQDEWGLTFFLDNSHKWIATSIIINSWKVVFNNVNLGE